MGRWQSIDAEAINFRRPASHCFYTAATLCQRKRQQTQMMVSGRGSVIDLKVEMKPPAKNIYRPALGIVGGIADELIVEADINRGGKSVFAGTLTKRALS
jgi:hypothetical protein